MQQPRVHNLEERAASLLVEETLVTQDRAARNKRRWDTLLAYATKLDDAWLVMRVKEGRPVTWRRCKVKMAIDAGKEQPP